MIKKIFKAASDAFSDVLILAGCGVIVYATSLLSIVAMWFVAGALLVGLGVVFGLPKTEGVKNDRE
jgi:hypothetical protein